MATVHRDIADGSHTRHCPHCHRLLIEIDHYGERLIGCIMCNRWGWPGSNEPFMALPEDDLQALSNLSDARHKAEDTTP
jgi:hypothetical protein